MARQIVRCWCAGTCGCIAGTVLAGLICWVWLSTVDGHQLDI